MNSLKLLGFGLFVVSAHHKLLKNADKIVILAIF